MHKEKSMVNKWMSRIAFYSILIIVWEAIFQLNVNAFHIWKSYSFPSPISVCISLLNLIQDNTLQIAISVSLIRVVIGYSISFIIGVALGLFVLQTGKIGENMSSLILGFQTLPSICWVPFAILWFGLNQSAIVFVIVVGSTFSIAVAVESSIRSVNPLYVRVAKNAGISQFALYQDVVFPAALPGILAGMKQGWSFAWRSLMAGEMMTATLGLGQVLMIGRDLADISQVVAVMSVIVILGLGIDQLVFGYLERQIREKRGLQSTSRELML